MIGVDLLAHSLLPAIVELAGDKHWRVRRAIIEYIPLLAAQLGINFFDEKLDGLCIQWLSDQVASIRDAAAVNLRCLITQFGEAWGTAHIVPSTLNLLNSAHYLYRITILNAIAEISQVIENADTRQNLVRAVCRACSDEVANVRFNAAKCLGRIAAQGDAGLNQNQIAPALKALEQDSDTDVRYYAKQALEKCSL